MQKLEIPDSLDDLDPDDFYDEVEDWLELSLPILLKDKGPEPSIQVDKVLALSYAIIDLNILLESLMKACEFLEEEMDTGLLQMRLQPLQDHLQDLQKRLKITNEMIYFFDSIKQTRKKAKRVTRKAKRKNPSDRFKELEAEADQLTDQQNFASQIEAYASQGLNTDALKSALERMEKQFEKMREALDSAIEKQV